MPRQLANSRSEAALFDFQSPVALRADTAVGVNELKKRTVAAEGANRFPGIKIRGGPEAITPTGLRGEGNDGVVARVRESQLLSRLVGKISRGVPFQNPDLRSGVRRRRVAETG